MIFAELDYSNSYAQTHHDLVMLIGQHFEHVKSGIQGDSWICIFDNEYKVEVDTFSSMKHQVKSDSTSPLVFRVIDVLRIKYKVNVFSSPTSEPHEG